MPSSGMAAGPATATVAVEYNGFRFPKGARTEAFSVEPVMDAAGRTIIYSKFRVTISAYLNLGVGGTSDALVNNALGLLTQPAAGFSYRGRGFGDIRVNLKGAQDCVWGPFPKVLTLDPKGANQTAKIVWTVEFHMPTCGDARYTGPMEFNYGTDISVDRLGLTTRTYKGFIRIAQTRMNQSDRTIRKSADEWMELVDPPPIVGFRRTDKSTTLSHDKCRLDFSFQDIELPGNNVPPASVIEAEASHSIGTAQPGRLFEWVGNLSATYTIPKNNPDGIGSAVQAFAALARDRIQGSERPGFGPAANVAAGGALNLLGAFALFPAGLKRAEAAQAGLVPPAAVKLVMHKVVQNIFKKRKPVVIPISFSASDVSIYDTMRVRLEMKYRLAGASLADILNDGGLWRPAPGPSWVNWYTSVAVPMRARGVAGLNHFYAGEDQIVDLCARMPGAPVKKAVKPPKQPTKIPRQFTVDNGFAPELRGGPPIVGGFAFTAPSEELSWMGFYCNTRVETTNNTVEVKTLPALPIGSASTSGADGGLWGKAGAVAALNRNAMQTGIQRRTGPTVHIFIEGYAMRAGYPVDPPGVVSVGGIAVEPVNRTDKGEGFSQAVVGNGGLDGSIPIYGASWRFRYLMPELPVGAPPVMGNPTRA